MQWQLIDPGNPLRGGTCHLLRLSGRDTTWLRIEDQLSVPQVWVLENDDWQRRLESVYPDATYKASLVYDPVRDRIVHFGGFDELGQPTNETWEHDGTTWLQRTDVGAPPARGRASMAYDSDRNVIVLFGGLGAGSTELNDVWEYDGASWLQVIPPLPHPPPRFDASMSYDAKRSRMVLAFGRNNAVGTLNDTWEYNGVNWILPPFQGSATPRYTASAAYDAVRERVYVFGGEGTAETAFWDGQNWQVVASANSPPARFDSSMAFDEARGTLLLFGGDGSDDLGDLWEFDGTDWAEIPSQLTSRPRKSSGMAFDVSAGRAIAYGGFDCCSHVYFDKTWEWDGLGWMEVLPNGEPGFRQNHAMAYDLESTSIVLFGGFDVIASDEVDTTWRYDSSLQSWTEVLTANRPPARATMAMVYSAVDDGLVMFGGLASADLNDTWVLRNGDWEELQPQTPPTPRQSPAMAFDELNSLIVMYGGFRSGSGLGDTWLLINGEWSLSPATGPGARVAHEMAYDPRRGVTVLGGGAEDTDESEVTWEFDGTNWNPVPTRYSPDMRRRFANMVWDPVREVVLFTAGSRRGPNSPYNDLWVYGWDEDDDGSVGGYDNCPAAVNPDQLDDDGDAAGNVCDCAPMDPGSFAAPVEVSGLTVDGQDPTVIRWDDQAPDVGSAVEYDLVSGGLNELRTDNGFASAQCLVNDLVEPSHTDSRTPVSGNGFYYVVRSTNACGTGSYGANRAVLDATSPCP